jgi:hypothetical protein
VGGADLFPSRPDPAGLQPPLDWVHLLQLARTHGVLPLLYRSLSTTCPEALPPAFGEQLRDAFYAHAGRNALLTKELLKLFHLLAGHGIAALPFKGPVLAEEVLTRLFTTPSRSLALAAWDRQRFYLRLRERWRDRLPCIGYLVHRTLLPEVLKSRIGRSRRLRPRKAEV